MCGNIGYCIESRPNHDVFLVIEVLLYEVITFLVITGMQFRRLFMAGDIFHRRSVWLRARMYLLRAKRVTNRERWKK